MKIVEKLAQIPGIGITTCDDVVVIGEHRPGFELPAVSFRK